MSKYDEALGAMRRAAEGEDEDAKKAKKALKAMEDGDKPPEKKEGEGEGKAKAEDEEEKKKEEEKAKAKAKTDADAKAKAEFPPEKKEEKEAKAMSFDLAREVAELKSERAKEKEAQQRGKLLAQRPDFPPEIVKASAAWPLEQLEEAVKTFPKMAVTPLRPARAATAMPSVRTDPASLEQLGATAEEATFISRQMGTYRKPAGVKFDVGSGDRTAAKAYLDQRAAQAKEGA